MPATLTQIVVGAAQFTGNTDADGLFSFAQFNALPRTTGIIIHSLSYVEIDSGPALTTNVQFWSRKNPGGAPVLKVPLGDGTAAGGLLDINGVARLKLCGHVLERNPGQHQSIALLNGGFWQIQVITQNKQDTAAATLTYDLCDFPESDLRGSTEV